MTWTTTREKFLSLEERKKLLDFCEARALLDLKEGRKSWVKRWLLIDLAFFSGLQGLGNR